MTISCKSTCIFCGKSLYDSEKTRTFATANLKNSEASTLFDAQMAELVDALVSNTNAARRAGSIPALGTFQNNSKSRKQLILRHLRDFSFYNNPLFAPHLLHKSILTFFLAVFLTVIRKLTVIAFMKYLNIPSLRKTRLVSIHGNSNLNICAPND